MPFLNTPVANYFQCGHDGKPDNKNLDLQYRHYRRLIRARRHLGQVGPRTGAEYLPRPITRAMARRGFILNWTAVILTSSAVWLDASSMAERCLVFGCARLSRSE